MKKELQRIKYITVLGEGAWGTAIATLLAHNGYQVRLWCHHADLVDAINTTHTNEQFLPGITLDTKIKAVASLQEALEGAAWVFEAIPVKYLRQVLMAAQPWIHVNQKWVVLSKGIEQETLLLPTQIIDKVFKKKVMIAVVAGPSFAMDLAQQKMTAVSVAAVNEEQAKAVRKLLANNYFRPYTTTDIIGVQVGAALKNVIAIGVGMLDGAGYSDNTKAFLLTRGLTEMAHMSKMRGGKQKTVFGLSGIGDLMLSCTSSLSRNLTIGRELGKGKTLASLSQPNQALPEGINTVQSVYQFVEKKDVPFPICRGIYAVIFMKVSMKDFLQDMSGQPFHHEFL